MCRAWYSNGGWLQYPSSQGQIYMWTGGQIHCCQEEVRLEAGRGSMRPSRNA